MAPQSAAQFEELGVAEGQLGLLYLDLVPVREDAAKRSKVSLAQRLKNMANVPLAALKETVEDDVDEEESSDSFTETRVLALKERARSMRQRAVTVNKISVNLVEEVVKRAMSISSTSSLCADSSAQRVT